MQINYCTRQELLQDFHKSQHQVNFYAEKLHLSVANLSKKVKAQFHVSIGQLIRSQIIATAQSLLLKGKSVKDVAWEMGFSEPHHFSAFFKHYTGRSPSHLTDHP
jgi:AraC-like DNA-binding protein